MPEYLKLIVDAKATLGEGPCWDSLNRVFYWVDILEKNLHIYDPKNDSNRVIHLGQIVGAVVPRASGGVVLAMQNGFYSLDLHSEELTPIVDPESSIPTNRFNDGKCDALGRFWAGTMDLDEREERGALYCLNADHSYWKAREHISISNGITWSPDHKTMYFIDSLTRGVLAFDFELTTGKISNERMVITLPEDGGLPDGMTTDEEGMLWIAQWDGWQVSRWNPLTGQLLEVIRVPAARVTSCAFGGANLDTLYITTARVGINPDDLLKQPLAGGVFALKTKTRGIPTFSYNG